MSDEAALLAAIASHAEDDLPRLVYADWLEEHATGEADRARAEFIRVQCELAGLYYARDKARERYAALESRQAELASRYAKEWVADFLIEKADQELFGRGFLVTLELSARNCLKLPRPPWHKEPMLRLTLSGSAADVRRLCERGWLDGVPDLWLQPSRAEQARGMAEAVARSTCAATLRELSLWGEGFNDDALEAVADGAFRDLRDLSCMGQFTPAGWEAVLNSPAAGRLEELTIGHRAPWQTADATRPGPRLAAVLASAPVLPQLKKLWLTGCGMGNAGLTRFFNRGSFTRLENLDLDSERPGLPALRALGAADAPQLTRIRLSQCELNDATLAALLASPLASRLRHLDLSLNNLTATAVRAVAKSPLARRLAYLDFGCNDIGDEGARVLARSRRFTAMEELHLSTTEMGDEGAEAILRAEWMGRLKVLFMSYNHIPPERQAELTARFGSALWISGEVDEP